MTVVCFGIGRTGSDNGGDSGWKEPDGDGWWSPSGFFAVLRMTAKTYSSRNNVRDKSSCNDNGSGKDKGVSAGQVPWIPPIAKLRDGWGTRACGWSWRTGGGRQIADLPFRFGKPSLFTLREPVRYLDAFFFLVAVFLAAVFFAAFFFDFLGVPPPGLTTATSFVPMGVPRPVQGSQPGPALKPTGVPL
jgi:hypothetical protein